MIKNRIQKIGNKQSKITFNNEIGYFEEFKIHSFNKQNVFSQFHLFRHFHTETIKSIDVSMVLL